MLKTSRYNIFIEQKEAVIIYNTLWNSFLVTGKSNANLIQKGIFEASRYKNEKLFNALVEIITIIDSTVDEIKIIRKILYQTNSDPAYFEIIINPTLACDFSKDHIEGSLKSDGTISWNTLHRKRMQATPLNFQSCIECSILPICVGGCSQRLIENEGGSDCPLGMNLLKKQEYAYRILSEKIERL